MVGKALYAYNHLLIWIIGYPERTDEQRRWAIQQLEQAQTKTIHDRIVKEQGTRIPKLVNLSYVDIINIGVFDGGHVGFLGEWHLTRQGSNCLTLG